MERDRLDVTKPTRYIPTGTIIPHSIPSAVFLPLGGATSPLRARPTRASQRPTRHPPRLLQSRNPLRILLENQAEKASLGESGVCSAQAVRDM